MCKILKARERILRMSAEGAKYIPGGCEVNTEGAKTITKRIVSNSFTFFENDESADTKPQIICGCSQIPSKELASRFESRHLRAG